MTKPSPLDQEFWDIFGELFSNRVADILNPDDDCPFRVVAVVYPDKTSPLIDKCGPNHEKGGIVDVALDLAHPRGDLSKLTG